LRDGIPDIRKAGAELVIIGNGGTSFAAAFREDFGLDGPLLVDPELHAYRAAGLRRGRVEALSPKLAWSAARALRTGHRQTGVEGDPWQLGGAFVIRPDGGLVFRHVADHAGDHARLDAILEALAPGAPAIDERVQSSPLQKRFGRLLGRLLDPTIVLSFDRNGFRTHALTFDPDDLDVDLRGRRCLITGANSGIGFETALALADLGADVVMLCRSELRGEQAAERIREQTGSRRVSVVKLDVSDLAAVRAVGEQLAGGSVDVLVHNAGVLPGERRLTRDGLELCFATHVVGPHLLTKRLAPRLAESPSGRVVFVSSGGMYTQRLDLHDLDWSERDYDGVRAYAQTKRMQVVMAGLWGMEFARDAVAVNAMHPGWADTASVRASLPGFHRVTRAILRSPAEAADSVVWLAASEPGGAITGEFIFDRHPRGTHYLPGTRERQGDRARLWQLCERLAAGSTGSR
jgi:dehydrogenase/reductase SDR family protein 12